MTQPEPPSQHTSAASEPGQRIALVVSVNGYEQDDAGIAQVLRRSECGFDEHTLFDKQAVAGAIQGAFFDLRDQFRSDNLRVLSFGNRFLDRSLCSMEVQTSSLSPVTTI